MGSGRDRGGRKQEANARLRRARERHEAPPQARANFFAPTTMIFTRALSSSTLPSLPSLPSLPFTLPSHRPFSLDVTPHAWRDACNADVAFQ